MTLIFGCFMCPIFFFWSIQTLTTNVNLTFVPSVQDLPPIKEL